MSRERRCLYKSPGLTIPYYIEYIVGNDIELGLRSKHRRQPFKILIRRTV